MSKPTDQGQPQQDLNDLQGRTDSLVARPLRWGELPDVLALFTPAVTAASANMGNLFGWLVEQKIVVPGQKVTLDSATTLRIVHNAMPMIGQVPELLRAVQSFTAIVTDLSLEDVRQLDMDRGTALAIEAFRVNQDFFSQRLLPLLRESWRQAKSKLPDPPATDNANSQAGTASSSA